MTGPPPELSGVCLDQGPRPADDHFEDGRQLPIPQDRHDPWSVALDRAVLRRSARTSQLPCPVVAPSDLTTTRLQQGQLGRSQLLASPSFNLVHDRLTL
jgi:hypothetical protein